MVKHVWSIICNKSVIDSESNTISLFDVMEQININIAGPKPPEEGKKILFPIQFEIVSLWTRENIEDPVKAEGRAKFIGPSEKGLGLMSFDIDLSGFVRTRTRQKVSGFPFEGSGLYYFKIECKREGGDWEQVADLPLQVFMEFNEEQNKQEH